MSSEPGQNKSEMPVANVVSLADLVNYQGGPYQPDDCQTRTGTVTLFAFDEDQGLSEHTAAFDAVAHLLEGEAEITVSGKPMQPTAGDAVFLPANEPHFAKAVCRFKMLFTMIRS